MNKKVFSKAITATLPVMAGYIFLGIGFGVILSSKGFGPLWAWAMSTFIFAGSMEYAAIGLLTSPFSPITVAITTIAVNARHVFYGISMIDRYKDAKLKPALIFMLTDETYSIVSNKPAFDNKEEQNFFCVLVSGFNMLYWNIGSVLGAVLGTAFSFTLKGLDFALTALFVAIVTEQWLSTKNHIAAINGLLSTLLCLVIFGKDNFLIPAMILMTTILAICRKNLEASL
ncbi:MAG: AzlC family ABC transporter permease [Sphaerochaetaceae bacterium]|nr:AzlC family ABC transporter permease [Sphaerochaetaceae bacterium]